MASGSNICLILIAIIFPPAAVAFISGCSCDLLINIVLTILGYLPGHIHAFWLIYKQMKAEELYGRGGYQYIGNGKYTGRGMVNQNTAQVPPPAAQPGYGATQAGPY